MATQKATGTGSTESAPNANTTTTTTTEDTGVSHAEAHGVIHKYSAIAAAAALVPIPAVDLVTLAGVQAKMVHSIGNLHGVKIQENKLKVAVAALISTLPARAFTAAGASALKVIPGIGSLLGTLASPAYFASTTYGIGKVFHAHFSTGGTLLNFNPDEMKEYYQSMVKEKATAN